MTEANALKAADEYRKQAADCRKHSECAAKPFHKEKWLKIAEEWDHLAQVADRYANRITGAPP
jgi:hypothetical protein